jgi:hypothetical protein
MDIAHEQARFLQSAHQDGADAARRMFEAVVPLAQQASFTFDEVQKSEHDFITFPSYSDILHPAANGTEDERKVA